MSRLSPLLLTLFALLASTLAVVHRIPATQQRVPIEVLKSLRGLDGLDSEIQLKPHLPEEASTHLARVRQLEREVSKFRQQSAGPLSSISEHADDDNSSSSSGSTIPLDVSNYGYLIVGNVSVGTPAQQLRLNFDINRAHLYVVGQGATYTYSYSSSSGSKVGGRNRVFNVSQSSTYQGSPPFIADTLYRSGGVGSDVINVGEGISLNATVQVASTVSYNMAYYNMDGSFGLSTNNSGAPGQTLMAEVMPHLDEPVVTVWVNRSSAGCSCNGEGEITLGGLNPEKCNAARWTNVGNGTGSYNNLPSFNVSSISGPPTGNGSCANSVEAQFTISLDTRYSTIYTSIQVQDVFVKASGAVYNRTKYSYVVPADKVATAQPVILNLASGGQLQMTADDYIVKGWDGTNYLYVYGYYDQNKVPVDTIQLGQSFLTNHCVSQNLQTGEWSLTPIVKAAPPAADQ